MPYLAIRQPLLTLLTLLYYRLLIKFLANLTTVYLAAFWATRKFGLAQKYNALKK